MHRASALYDVLEPANAAEFRAAIEAARRAALASGDEARALVEQLLGRGLSGLGERDEARRVFAQALADLPGALRLRASLYVDWFDELVAANDLHALVEHSAAAERAIEAASLPPAERAVALAAILRARAQTAIELGLPDVAASEARRLADLEPALPRGERLLCALQRGNVLLAAQMHEALEPLARAEIGALERLDASASADLEAELGPGVVADSLARWRVRLGIALSELARGEATPATGARAVRAALDRARAVEPSSALDARRNVEPRRAIEAESVLSSAAAHAAFAASEAFGVALVRAELAVRAGRHASARDLVGSARALFAAFDPAEESTVTRRTALAALEAEIALELAAADPGDHAEIELAAHAHELESSLDALAAAWRARPTLPGGQGFLCYPAPRDALVALVRVETALHGPAAAAERGFAALVRAQRVGSSAAARGVGSIEPAEVRGELCRDGAVLLAFVPGARASVVLVVGASDASSGELAARGALDEAQRDFGSLVQLPPWRSADRAKRERDLASRGSALASALFPPEVRERLRAAPTWIESGTELFGSPPLEALQLFGERALGTQFALAHAPSYPLATALARVLAEVRAPGRFDVVLVAAPEISAALAARTPPFAPLELGSEDAFALVEGFERLRVDVAHGPDAGLDALRADDVSSAGSLQLFTHGVFDASRPRPAGLVLSPRRGPDVAWAEDLAKLRVPRVVALWACGSARGPSRLGDDTGTHLGSALFEAGAASVVLGTGDLALDATRAAATSFNRAIARGDGPAEALRSARAALASREETRDPFFHALLVLHGAPGATRGDPAKHEPRAASEPAGDVRWLVATLAAGLAFGAWTAVRRLRSARAR